VSFFYDPMRKSTVLMRLFTSVAFTLERCGIQLTGSDMTESETESSVASQEAQYSRMTSPGSPALSVLSLSMSARDEMFFLKDGRTYPASDSTYPFPVFSDETLHCGMHNTSIGLVDQSLITSIHREFLQRPENGYGW
jgi:hypothetical protein